MYLFNAIIRPMVTDETCTDKPKQGEKCAFLISRLTIRTPVASQLRHHDQDVKICGGTEPFISMNWRTD